MSFKNMHYESENIVNEHMTNGTTTISSSLEFGKKLRPVGIAIWFASACQWLASSSLSMHLQCFSKLLC